MGEGTVQVGAHPWVYAAGLPGYDITPVLDDIFADVKAAGFGGIELMHTALLHDGADERVGELSARHALPVIGSSFGAAMWDRGQHEAIRADAQRVVAALAAVGAQTLGISVGAAPTRKTDAQLDAQAVLVAELIDLCEQHGVQLNLHNHTYEVVDDLHDLRGTLARVPEAKLGPDLNWLVRGGVDPLAFIAEFGDRIVFVHLRDQTADGRWVEAMGEGDLDHAAYAQALRDVGFAGPAVVELAHERDFTPTRPLRESLRISREYVREVMGY